MKTFRETMREMMLLAWQFVKKNGFGMAEAMKQAWQNIKAKAAMQKGIVKFRFVKVDGSMREAYGTLKVDLLPKHEVTNRRQNDTVQVYFDTEKREWRCFKKANLICMLGCTRVW